MSYRFFSNSPGSEFTLSAEDFFHLTRVLRIKKGETYEIVSGNLLGRFVVKALNPFASELVETSALLQEKSPQITLYYALPKGDKLDLVVQKAVELGVDAIVLVDTSHSVVTWDLKRSDSKRQRYLKIARSAAMQSKRNYVPEIDGIIPFKDALTREHDLKLFAHVGDDIPLHEALHGALSNIKSIGIFIGPEGGFSNDEVAYARSKGYKVVSFGPNVLRTETAVFYVLSVLHYNKEGQTHENL